MEKYPDFFNKSDSEKVDKKERKSKKDEDEKEKSKTSSFLDAIKSLFTRDQSQEEIDRMLKEARRIKHLQEQAESRQEIESSVTEGQGQTSRPEREQYEEDSFYDNKSISFLGKKILKYIGLDSTPNRVDDETQSFSHNQSSRTESTQTRESLDQKSSLEESASENTDLSTATFEEAEISPGRRRFEGDEQQPSLDKEQDDNDVGYPSGEPGPYSSVATRSLDREEVRVIETKDTSSSAITEWFYKKRQGRENKALKKAIKNTEEKLSDQSTEIKEQERLIKRLETLKQIESKPIHSVPETHLKNFGERLSTDKTISPEKDRQTGNTTVEKRPKRETANLNKPEKITFKDNKSIEIDRSRMQADKAIEDISSEDKKEYTPEFSQYYRNQDLAGRSEADLMQEKEEVLKKNNLILDNKIIEKIKKKDQLNQALKPKNIRKDPTLSAFYTLIIVFTIVLLLIIFT